MSLEVSVLRAEFSSLMDGNSAKLFAMLAAMAALFLVARWISARGESSAHDPSLIRQTGPDVRPAIVAEDAPPLEAPVHPEMDFGDVVLRKLYFGGFDAITGPADPASFVDEATVEVYSKQTGASFENTFTVATPVGLNQLLRDKQWESLYSPQIFIVNRYDLRTIREAIMERLLDDLELQRPTTASDSGNHLIG